MSFNQVAHYAPHSGVTFEGYYSKFRFPSQASVTLIVSAVPGAARKAIAAGENPSSRNAFSIAFIYVSPDSTYHWKRDYWPESLETDQIDNKHDLTKSRYGFTTRWDHGEFSWRSPSMDGKVQGSVSWRLKTDEVEFKAETISDMDRIPWRMGYPDSTPAGPLVNLPLPIQWHVHSIDSPSRFILNIKDSDAEIHSLDHRGECRAHIEKNWAISFPKSYIWLQARDFDRGKGLTLAGGSLIPGVSAYLVGYHGSTFPFLSFGPPTASTIFGLSMGLRSDVDYRKRRVDIDIKGWFRRLRIVTRADPDTFFNFAAPLQDGHAPDYCTQSFGALMEVTVYQRSWPWQDWETVESETFERASLEFGGGYFEGHRD